MAIGGIGAASMSLSLMTSSDTVERLARDHGQRGWRLAVSLMGNAADADDVMQQAYIIAATKEHAIPRDNPWGWFAAVITNVSRNARRSRGRSSDRFKALEGDAHEDFKAHDPADEAESAELCERLRGELESLPEAEREAVVLTHITGMTHAMAADALNVPLGTLKSHVRRGVERLRVRMSVSDTALASAFFVLPINAPVGGMTAAIGRWTETARSTAAEGGASAWWKLGSNRFGSITGSVMALLIGLGTGCLLTATAGGLFTSSSSLDLERQAPVAAPKVDSGDAGTRTRNRDSLRNHRQDRANKPTPAQALRTPLAVPATPESASNGTQLDANDEGLSHVDDANAEASGSGTVQDLGLPIPYQGWNQYGALGTIEWNELAKGMNTYQDLLEEVYNLRLNGRAVSDDLKSRLAFAGAEMERQRFRALTKVYDGLPTNTTDGNGEWTHPAVSSNLMAVRLRESGHALSSDQIDSIVDHAAEYDRRWEEFQRNSGSMSRIERLAGELALKQDFHDGVNRVLTPAQSASLASDRTRGIAGLDAQSPANMVPINPNHNGVVAANQAQARALLMDRVAADMGMPRSSLDGYEYVFDQWVNEATTGSTSPMASSGAISTEELLKATEAQSRAYRTLTQVAPQSKPIVQGTNTATTVFVPQVVPQATPVVVPPAPAPTLPPLGQIPSWDGTGPAPDPTLNPDGAAKPDTGGEHPRPNAPNTPAGSSHHGESVDPDGRNQYVPFTPLTNSVDPSAEGEQVSPALGASTHSTSSNAAGTDSNVAGVTKSSVDRPAASNVLPEDRPEIWKHLIDDSRFPIPGTETK